MQIQIPGKKRETKTPQELRREKWLSELRQVKNELDANEMLFNMTDDFDLTDYTIHQKTALEARYSFLIRLIRTHDEAACRAVPPDAAHDMAECGLSELSDGGVHQ